ncbi:ABC transporter substrate binding protein [Bradyrhizobium sp.]|uniref:ABC transporter substrate binding protein n=1 Tax=Bradyrhizobium sp. TaxID=376 RepID=UPI002D2FA187|nr:ABC transporter substrate binding protein [Bradyrhizobium sp.]HZR76121.1 ABC transporter substrate binding protein [Bradyrhizobium sp.]
MQRLRSVLEALSGENPAQRKKRKRRHPRLHIVGSDELEATYAQASQAHIDAAILQPSLSIKRGADLALKYHLPTACVPRWFAEAGGLLSYCPKYSDTYRQAASYVDKVLKGAKPADLPVQQPIRFELVINLKTAKALGLTVPPSLLTRADDVIE